MFLDGFRKHSGYPTLWMLNKIHEILTLIFYCRIIVTLELDRAHTVSLSSAEGAQVLGLLAEGVPARDRERDSMSSTSTYSTISSSLSLAFNSASGSNLTPAQLSGMQMNNHSVSAVSSMIGSQVNSFLFPLSHNVLYIHIQTPILSY